ncbi:GNAT family N-acetyltransferase [Muricoccus radiodurans]|uniref:GNAT family N-acetyltransferase n=1 Tax=Muricoccus radiodurans TaxID=2231721 RepID=UPI003CEE37A7
MRIAAPPTRHPFDRPGRPPILPASSVSEGLIDVDPFTLPPQPDAGPSRPRTAVLATPGETPVPAQPGLPAWCDLYFRAPGEDFFASRTWYDTVAAQALAPGQEAAPLVVGGVVLWPLLREADRIRSLTTPYTLSWRPLAVPAATEPALRAAGQRVGEALRAFPPTSLDAVDPEAAGLSFLLDGLRDAGLAVMEHAHFGNWHEAFPSGLRWADYLASRSPALRTTIRRKLARAGRETRFELLTRPGHALEAGIAAYVAVRARSWKPHEPFPHFDPALMRAAAADGVLRLGVLWDAGTGDPVAVQYWIVSGRRGFLLKLCHDEARRDASPGTALTALMVRGLLDDDGVRELDFGRGDDPYKALWVSQRRQRIGLVLASPRNPLGLMAVARHVAGRVRRRGLDTLKARRGAGR